MSQFRVSKREIWHEVHWDVKEVGDSKVLIFLFPNEEKAIEIPFTQDAAEKMGKMLSKPIINVAPAEMMKHLPGLPGGPAVNGRT